MPPQLPPPDRIAPAVPGVPWIATWDSERSSTALLVSSHRGLRWFNETMRDRDPYGALWARRSQHIGRGRPEYAGVHPRRQRLAMELLLCHLCSGPASVTREGVLWMDPVAPGEPMSAYTSHPPVCLPCAVDARKRCPRIRRTGAHTVRVANPRPWGLVGTLFEPRPDGTLTPGDSVQIGYDDPRTPWALATQRITYLDGVIEIDLDEEYALELALHGVPVRRARPLRTEDSHV
ncbi:MULTISPECIES: hypothetical protein [Streptomyces]|uniref:hypothetical protein n=1 Tax=Streptomyces TaxID=1883 RepID=UPI000692322A|nr:MULTISPECIES: hypothetical protein [Streptomyces]